MVNGPEDPLRLDLDTVGWDWIDWCSVEREVRRLRQRIFKASQEGDLAKARSLQKLMLRGCVFLRGVLFRGISVIQ